MKNKRAFPPLILVTEDSADILELLELALSKGHYAVLGSRCAAEALSLWEKHGQGIDLLITDVRLGPGGSGLELARRLLGFKPSLKVLLISGLGAAHRAEGGAALEFLRKPFSFAELQARVDALLTASARCDEVHPQEVLTGWQHEPAATAARPFGQPFKVRRP